MIKCVRMALVAFTIMLFPLLASAQIAGEIHSMKSVLDQLYDDMMPLCSQLIGVGRDGHFFLFHGRIAFGQPP